MKQCLYCEQDPLDFELFEDGYGNVACDCGLNLPGVDPDEVGWGFHIIDIDEWDPFEDWHAEVEARGGPFEGA